MFSPTLTGYKPNPDLSQPTPTIGGTRGTGNLTRLPSSFKYSKPFDPSNCNVFLKETIEVMQECNALDICLEDEWIMVHKDELDQLFPTGAPSFQTLVSQHQATPMITPVKEPKSREANEKQKKAHGDLQQLLQASAQKNAVNAEKSVRLVSPISTFAMSSAGNKSQARKPFQAMLKRAMTEQMVWISSSTHAVESAGHRMLRMSLDSALRKHLINHSHYVRNVVKGDVTTILERITSIAQPDDRKTQRDRHGALYNESMRKQRNESFFAFHGRYADALQAYMDSENEISEQANLTHFTYCMKFDSRYKHVLEKADDKDWDMATLVAKLIKRANNIGNTPEKEAERALASESANIADTTPGNTGKSRRGKRDKNKNNDADSANHASTSKGNDKTTPKSSPPKKGKGDGKKVYYCNHFGKFGTCKFGDKCKFKHVDGKYDDTFVPRGKPKDSDPDKSSKRDEEKNAAHDRKARTNATCDNWSSTGTCPWGLKCKYAHVGPPSNKTQKDDEAANMAVVEHTSTSATKTPNSANKISSHRPHWPRCKNLLHVLRLFAIMMAYIFSLGTCTIPFLSPHEEQAHMVSETKSHLDSIIDSGTTSHMVPDSPEIRKLMLPGTLENIPPEETIFVRIADNTSLPATQTATFALGGTNRTTDGVILLRNTLLVPGLSKPLISVSKLTDDGIDLFFTGRKMTLYSNNKDVLTLTRPESENLYRVPLHHFVDPKRAESANLASTHTGADLLPVFHKRLGHLNYRKLLPIWNPMTNQSVQPKDKPWCDSCAVAKVHKQPFPKASRHQPQHVLQHIHIDSKGPLKVRSPHGHKYYMLGKDMYHRYRMIVPFASKTEFSPIAIGMLKRAAVQQQPYQVTYVHADNELDTKTIQGIRHLRWHYPPIHHP